MTPEVLVFSEGAEYLCNEYMDLIHAFENNAAIINIKGSLFSFKLTGFLIFNNTPVVVFPKNFETTGDSFKQDAAILLRVLLRYRMESIHTSEENQFLNGSETNSNGRIVAAVVLLNDFQTYGYLKRTERIKTTYAKGNIDWAATVNRKHPVISQRRLYYTDPVIRQNVEDVNNIVIQIHKAVISECLQLWGWMMGLSSNDISCKMPCDDEKAVRILKNELLVTYANREIEVLRNMIAYLQCKTGKRKYVHFELLATPFFYYVWEYICGHIFENQYAAMLPVVAKPVWKNCPVKHNVSQRPDILFINGKGFFILDAKYYDYNNSLPGWNDVAKQLLYKYTIENNKSVKAMKILEKTDRLYNAFIFPQNDTTKTVYIGTVAVEDVADLGEIHAFAINTRLAMYAYASGEKSKLKYDVVRALIGM